MRKKQADDPKKFVWLSCPCQENLKALKEILEREGYRIFSPIDAPPDPSATFVLLGSPLSKKELTILQTLADEGNVKRAAKRLGLKPSTIHKHLRSITASLGVHSTLHAVVISLRKGLIH